MAADEEIGKRENSGNGFGDPRETYRVTWAPFYALERAVWIDGTELEGLGAERGTGGGLVVLPINIWGNGQRHSGAEDFESAHACINHQFGRTWKKGWWEYMVG